MKKILKRIGLIVFIVTALLAFSIIAVMGMSWYPGV